MSQQPEPTDPHPASPAERGQPNRRVTSEELLQGDRELLIDHRGEVYRLRLTRAGKLILHK